MEKRTFDSDVLPLLFTDKLVRHETHVLQGGKERISLILARSRASGGSRLRPLISSPTLFGNLKHEKKPLGAIIYLKSRSQALSENSWLKGPGH